MLVEDADDREVDDNTEAVSIGGEWRRLQVQEIADLSLGINDVEEHLLEVAKKEVSVIAQRVREATGSEENRSVTLGGMLEQFFPFALLDQLRKGMCNYLYKPKESPCSVSEVIQMIKVFMLCGF